MKKFILATAFIVLAVTTWAQEKVEYVLFVSPSCVHCNKLKQEYEYNMKKK